MLLTILYTTIIYYTIGISFYTTIHTTASLIRETNLRLPVTETKLVGPRVLYASYWETILHDQFNSVIPGYSLLGRMKGLDQLKGVIKAIN